MRLVTPEIEGKCDSLKETLRDEAFRQSRRYANAKRGQRPQLPLKANAPKTIDFRGLTKSMICSSKFIQNYLDLGGLTNPFTCAARR
ncbi:MAG: hypothetical protein F6K56_08085 [Moorea sp. SIO3G5]|nr:hypothetical protein [Moorena sp. SIO3G5]